ncbi:ubiquitin carboxyl-terminal hydrolase 23 isoform X2 [Mercurialis annua]|uniref:ubiquitin carboxyl-terminal hydrolase 23 isoform X2 n=1 Tax=Mercurialis annua TaxID=3986 RepID=UPI00215ECFBA|nr:ubiquitin carboxyl-terminal hydrolase 23 isoform X2 [Mercurialis annua]
MESMLSDLRIVSKQGQEEEEKSCVVFRRIEFHHARKQFNGFTNSIGNDFRIETLNPDSGPKRVALSSSQQSSLKKVIDGSDLLENAMDPELSFHITFRKIGAGLENLGNTCFLNSVLQCLTYTEPLAAYLQSGKHQTSCHIAGFCALCAIQKHVSRALQSSGRSLVPKDLVSNLRCISRNFRNSRQEDAHEYMVNLLESMHKCCLPSGVPSESPAAYEKSLVHKIFGGSLRSQVECQQCFYCSNKFDPFLDLSLEIARAETLPVALRNFTAAELLDGGEKHYQCQKCKQKVRAQKRLTVHNVPNVLSIHLKRFHAHDPGRKVDKKVLFDRALDMKPFVSGSYEGDLKYSLYGVLVHFGHSTHSGHYVCFVRTSSGIWHLLNDNEVRPVSEKLVLEQKAYMLFYVRDRKINSFKKPADLGRENVKASVSNNLPKYNIKQMSQEHVDKGSIANRSLAASVTNPVNKKDALNFSISKEIPQKKPQVQPLISDCLLAKTKPTAEPSSTLPLQNNPYKEVSTSPDLGECVSSSAPSVNGKYDSSKVDIATVASGPKMSDCNKTSQINEPQSAPTEKLVMCESSEKINLVLNVGVDGAVENVPRLSQSDYGGKVSKTIIDSFELPNKPTCGNSQGGGYDNQSSSENSLGDQTNDNGKQIVNELPEPSIPSVTPIECLHQKATDCIPHKKLKKKLLKRRFSSMHLGLKFFPASLRLRKKKKHRKLKRNASRTQNLIKEQMLESNNSLSEVGPSTSKMSMSISLNSTHSQRRRATSRSKSSVMDVVDEKSEKRNNQNRDAKTVDKDLKNSLSTSELNQHNVRVIECAETSRKNMSGNGMMCMLTQGLEETTVARWDGVELPKSQNMASSSTENLHIGHVPDEWDEEYDRGKRKKVRQNLHEFGGPNPFQELSSKKTHFKRAKMDRSSSGNRPFRI